MRTSLILFIFLQLFSTSNIFADNIYHKLNKLLQGNSIVVNTKKIGAEDTKIDVILPDLSTSGPNFNVVTQNTFDFIKKSLKETPTTEPLLLNDNIYILDNNGYLVARKLKDLSLIWKTKIDISNHTCAYGSINYKDEVLYLTYGDKYLVAVNAKNGYELYRKKFDSMILGSPTIEDNKIYIQTMSDSLYKVNSLDGNILWTLPSLNDNSFISTKMSPKINKNEILILSVEGMFNGFDKNTSNLLYSIDPRDLNEVVANKNPTKAVAIEDNNLYVALNTDQIVLFRTPKGSIVWKKNIPNVQQISLLGNILLVVTNGHQIIALDKDTANTLWVNDIGINAGLNARKAVPFLKPVYFNNFIFLATNKYLFQIDALNGKLLKKAYISRLEKPISSHVFNETLYLLTNKNLYTLK